MKAVAIDWYIPFSLFHTTSEFFKRIAEGLKGGQWTSLGT